MADRRLSQPVDVKGRRRTEASAHNHSLAIADSVMARGAKNIEALLPAPRHPRGHGERKGIHRPAANFSGIEMLIGLELASGDRTLD